MSGQKEGGYTRSYRRRWIHPVFKNLRSAAVFAWMTDEAAWRATSVNFCGNSVELARGQLVTSQRYIAEQFEMERASVRRLIAKLEEAKMIAANATPGGTIITVVNYDKYQAQADERAAHQPAHQRPTNRPTPTPCEAIEIEQDKGDEKHEAAHPAHSNRPTSGPHKKEVNNTLPNGRDASGADNIDLAKSIFTEGRLYLQECGLAEAKARSVLGKWRKRHADSAIIEAIITAQRNSAQDPVPYIERVLGQPDSDIITSV